jgi:hypothetical protein
MAGVDRRALRKRGVLLGGGEDAASARARADEPTARRLRRINAVSATAFVIGGSLFSLGALFAQADIGGPRLAAAVYLLGGLFFTTGAYAGLLQVATPRAAPTPTASSAPLPGAGGRWSRDGSTGRAR